MGTRRSLSYRRELDGGRELKVDIGLEGRHIKRQEPDLTLNLELALHLNLEEPGQNVDPKQGFGCMNASDYVSCLRDYINF
jgi:hypothetical protein